MLALTVSFRHSSALSVSTGQPRFGSFGGSVDAVNLGNLNVHLAIPVLHRRGGECRSVTNLTYDSSVGRLPPAAE